jgi:signal transduction histidine kinase
MASRVRKPLAVLILSGVVLVGIYVAMVLYLRRGLRDEIRQTIIDRDASALRPVALRQLAQRELTARTTGDELLTAVLESAQQENMLAIAVFDAQAEPLQSAPASLLFAELPLDDYVRLLSADSISRYHPEFPLSRYFAGMAATQTAPVLEVWITLHGRDPKNILGFAQYYIDARSLAAELALTDQRINRQTSVTLGIGAVLLVAVLVVVFFRLRRAGRLIDERNEQLVRKNFELTLAVKASALGQITSHLIHGLQGPVASLRAMVASRGSGEAADWDSAADYTERMQTMIHEAVSLLSDSNPQTAYELTGYELAELVRKRNQVGAEQRGVKLTIHGGFDRSMDHHRGSLLCLIVNNLIENALAATDAGHQVSVIFRSDGQSATVIVSDEGHGIPPEIREHLFEPGRTGRPEGTGLGLAISQLLARQIDATLNLESTGADGTVFRITLPFEK